jgi:replicative DNA helicase
MPEAAANSVYVANFPTTALWILAISQIVFALATAAIAIVLIVMMKALLGELKTILADVRDMEREVKNHLPKMVKNVDMMVNDVASTTHKGTGVANQVLNLVSAIVTRLESPLVRSVGVITGVMAGLKALRGAKEREVVVERRRGFLGRKK